MEISSQSAILVGFVATIIIVGLAGGVTLIVFIYMKYKEYKKRQRPNRVLPSGHRQRHRRGSRQVRVRAGSFGQQSGPYKRPTTMQMPPAYTETVSDPPPPYTPLGVLNPTITNLQRESGNTRGSVSGPLTPIPQGRPISRNPSFGGHHPTGTTNTPTGSMFRTSYPSTREHSASSNVRSMNMVQLDAESLAAVNNRLNVAVNIQVENTDNMPQNA